MTLLKFILTFFIIYWLMLYLKKQLTSFIRPKPNFYKQGKPQNPPLSTQDTIIPCPTCGIYNPTQKAFLSGGKYYCNQECFVKRASN